jgi:hypothetical protein
MNWGCGAAGRGGQRAVPRAASAKGDAWRLGAHHRNLAPGERVGAERGRVGRRARARAALARREERGVERRAVKRGGAVGEDLEDAGQARGLLGGEGGAGGEDRGGAVLEVRGARGARREQREEREREEGGRHRGGVGRAARARVPRRASRSDRHAAARPFDHGARGMRAIELRARLPTRAGAVGEDASESYDCARA